MKPPRHRAAAPLIALATILLSLCAWLLLPTGVVLQWLDEGAAIENLTVVLYLLTAAWLLLARGAIPAGVMAALALTMVAFAAREADWHIRFTGTSMLRVSYYLGPAPALHKAASLAALAGLFLAWIHLLRTGVRAWRAHRLERGAVGVNVLTVVVALAATKLLDRMLSVATEDLGFTAGPGARALQLALEEPLEMMLPVMVVASAWQYRAWTARGATAPIRTT